MAIIEEVECPWSADSGSPFQVTISYHPSANDAARVSCRSSKYSVSPREIPLTAGQRSVVAAIRVSGPPGDCEVVFVAAGNTYPIDLAVKGASSPGLKKTGSRRPSAKKPRAKAVGASSTRTKKASKKPKSKPR
ncbi:MAG TPA: hypothetical protein VGM56_06075 [Byssovorax sp.]|jgi:hypothetical protein